MRFATRIVPIALAASALALTGCATTAPGFAEACYPGKISIHDDSVAPGTGVLVRAEGVDCELRFTDDQEYRLVVSRPWEPDEYYVDLSVPVADDGSFEAVLQLPPDMPSGEAQVIVVDGYEATCGDGASCAAVSAPFTVLS